MGAIEEFLSKIDYFYIDKSKKEKWAKLKNSIIFKDMGNPELFLMSVVTGLKHGKRKKISNSSNLFRVRELGNNVWIALAIGYSELEDMHVFETAEGAREALRVCEEYANSGIDILEELMNKPSEFTINLMEELIKK
jgi:hypothetical protein